MQTRLLLIIPTMGRPDRAREAAMFALDNATLESTFVVLAVDGPHSDEQMAAYEAISHPRLGLVHDGIHRGMVATLNECAEIFTTGESLLADHYCDQAEDCPYVTHVAFMGDDHRVRTRGWDAILSDAAGPVGIAYGDDLLQGVELPTAVVMSADIVRTLGQMVPPTLRHLFVDDYWKALGLGAGILKYVPDVVIEHMHPSAGKAEMDDSYAVTNHPDRYESDGAAWKAYRDDGPLGDDLDKISVLIHEWAERTLSEQTERANR